MKMNFGLFIALCAAIATHVNAVGIGAACSATATCTVSNSYCRYLFAMSSCTNGACACNAGFTGSTCTAELLGYNAACTGSQCATGFTCTNSQCKCDPSTNTYRSVISMCLAPAMKALGETCAQTSECYNTGGATGGMTCQTVGSAMQCACATGYMAMSGLCQKPYIGQACTSAVGCRQWPIPLSNTDSSRQAEVCPSSGGTCGCPTTADAITTTFMGSTFMYCLQKTTAALLAEGTTCTASNQCASKICSTCMDGTSALKCVLLAGNGAGVPTATTGLLLALATLVMSLF